MAADTQWRRLTLLMIVICLECGGKNRIPDTPDTGKTYGCLGCKAILALAAESVATDGVREVDVPVGGGLRPATLQPRLSTRSRFRISERYAFGALIVIVLALHLFVLPYWSEPYMDEAYYVPEARAILDERAISNPEHPPLGKLFVAAGITVLGDNHWGWRVAPVVFAVASIAFFYFVCRTLAGKTAALFAAFLLVFESLTFVHSGLATLDVFALAFMLGAFLFYLRDRYILSGLFLALAGLCKMTGFLGLPVILIHWLIVKRSGRPSVEVVYMTALPVAAFMLLMPVLDWAATGEWLSPLDRLADMLSHHEGLTAGVVTGQQLADISRPWEWILSPIGHLSTEAGGTIALINPMVWMLIIPSMGFMLHEWVKRRSQAALFVVLWFASTCLVWIPLVLVTDRVSYLYYFIPAAGSVCLAIGMALERIWQTRSQKRENRRPLVALMSGYLALNVMAFLFLAPVLEALDSHINFLP